jgi:hypothetical protein
MLTEEISHQSGEARVSIREVAQLVGDDGSCLPSHITGPLTLQIPRERNDEGLEEHTLIRHTHTLMRMLPAMWEDLHWWIHQASTHNGRPLQTTQWGMTIETDASKRVEGMLSARDYAPHGLWSLQEK